MSDPFVQLLADIRACRRCADNLPLGPRPVVQADPAARLRIVGQAPGRKVHQSGVPWDDASGVRLRDWLGLTPAQFYDPAKVAIIPMGFCYPGKAASGDMPPRRECAPRWHDRLNAALPHIGLTILVGHYAQAHYLGGMRKATLGETVRSWRDYLASGWLPLPHPSPRNQPWLVKNPWFEAELIPAIRATVGAMAQIKSDSSLRHLP
ncbi:uracil-DNA glycosylase family protein [Sphingomonas sp. MMSM20]|uniref:uracil-DNA glycosylase family protein n=1 Tax=Sphingomonas lycopersici TaxID=2951807 RepID=UPI0022380811|nr:uracil-DNA glycosylase family protein [Sphingomonas lycopersici]MCW6530169.1 uracil-DNA glycosylase family protein [Sphingomonas lycopersici]